MFVQAPLPGMIRLGEVDLSAKLGCYLSVAGELLSIVISDGLDLVGDGKKRGVAGLLDGGCAFVRQDGKLCIF